MTWKCFIASLLIGAVVGHYVPASQRSLQQQMLLEAIENECTKYGHKEHFEKVQSGLDRYVECFMKSMDGVSLRDLQTSDPNKLPESLVTFVQSICLKKNDFNKCFDSLVDTLGPCTDPKVNVNKNKVIVSNMINYVCDNNAQNFKVFIEDGAIPCLTEQEGPLLQCTEKIHLIETLPVVPPSGTGTQGEQGANETELEKEVCSQVSDMTSCMQTVFGKCPKPSTAKFMSRVFDFLVEGSPCDSNELSLH